MTNRSNSPAPWIELSAAGAGLIAVMFFAMWARAAPPVCARFPETPRRVELSWDVDREHLANDLAAADRIARRYAAASPHADGRQALFLECHDSLLQQIASTHGVSLQQLHDSAE
jgi:hypothetical protein